MRIASINEVEVYQSLKKISSSETDIKEILKLMSQELGLTKSDIISILISNEIEISKSYSVTS